MGEVYTRFQTKTAYKSYPLRRHKPLWLTLGVSESELRRVGSICLLGVQLADDGEWVVLAIDKYDYGIFLT